ncbi:MAG: cysteine hydrolase family protein [Clostridiales bacterium]|jgi:nicotinamidase-related amidase|nr:cysteine hydrolase family protein [Clostridiales bacterium]
MNFLIVVDYQVDFYDGKLPAVGHETQKEIMPNVKKRIEEAMKDPDTVVVFTGDAHMASTYLQSAEGKNIPFIHCEKDTPGYRLIDEFKPFVKGIEPFTTEELDEAFDVLNPNFSVDNVNNIKSLVNGQKVIYLDKETLGSRHLPAIMSVRAGGKEQVKDVEFCGLYSGHCVIHNISSVHSYFPNAHLKVNRDLTTGVTLQDDVIAKEAYKPWGVEVTGAEPKLKVITGDDVALFDKAKAKSQKTPTKVQEIIKK